MASLLASISPWGLLVILIIFVSRTILDPLRRVPGPFLARWTDLWYMWHLVRGDFEQKNLELHGIYGPIVRYGPYRYSIRDASASRVIYGPGSQFAKSSWYSSWTNPGSWSLFADQDIRRHAKGRSLFQSTYSMSALVDYERYVDEGTDVFVKQLSMIAEKGNAVDMRHWFQCYAFDIIGAITYGERFGFLDHGDDVESLMSTLDGHLFYATIVGLLPSFHPFLFRCRNWWAGAKGAGRAYLLHFTLKSMKRHQDDSSMKTEPSERGVKNETRHIEEADETRPQSFLSKFLQKHAQDPAKFTHEHVVASCISNIVAGSDTTAISLSAVLHYMITTAGCLAKLRTEITTSQVGGCLSSRPTFKETSKMPYLQAIIKEALRIHPATGLPLERVVPPSGAHIGGFFFPGGNVVGINAWVEHRDATIFGPDAAQFRPERWLVDDADMLSAMNRHFMPFGLGSRVCIGRHIATLELTKLIPRIVRDFDFALAEVKDHDTDTSSWRTYNLWFVKPTNFQVRVKARPLEH